MNKKIAILFVALLLGCSLFACGYESTQEYDLITIRKYVERDESGVFTTKVNETTYIEISYQTPDGIKTVKNLSDSYVYVSEETKVIENEGDLYPKVYLTVDDYNKLYGLSGVD